MEKEIKNLWETIADADCWEVVFQGQKGILFRSGRIVKKRRKEIPPQELEEILQKEADVKKALRWYHQLPFVAPAFPEGFRRGFYGQPLHESRFAEDLEPGTYVYRPFFDHFHKDSIQLQTGQIPMVKVMTIDPEPKTVFIEGDVNFRITNVSRAYLEDHDYNASLLHLCRRKIGRHSRGKKLNQWADPSTLENLETDVLCEVQAEAKKIWEIEISTISLNAYSP